jgi:hypothetical protein
MENPLHNIHVSNDTCKTFHYDNRIRQNHDDKILPDSCNMSMVMDDSTSYSSIYYGDEGGRRHDDAFYDTSYASYDIV